MRFSSNGISELYIIFPRFKNRIFMYKALWLESKIGSVQNIYIYILYLYIYFCSFSFLFCFSFCYVRLCLVAYLMTYRGPYIFKVSQTRLLLMRESVVVRIEKGIFNNLVSITVMQLYRL